MKISSQYFRSVTWGVCLLFGACPLSSYGQNEKTPVQEEETYHPPTRRAVTLPPKSYTFSMLLPPGTDCSVRMKLKGRKEENKSSGAEQTTPEESLYALRIERMFRDGICVSKQLKPDKSEAAYYFLKGWIAYDTPTLGLNVRRFFEDSQLCDLSNYHFPELVWAVPETRQPDPKVEDGQPAIHVYKDGDTVLVTDATSGFPLRYTDGNSQWTYSYKTSNTPVVLPVKLQQALDRIIAKSSRKK